MEEKCPDSTSNNFTAYNNTAKTTAAKSSKASTAAAALAESNTPTKRGSAFVFGNEPSTSRRHFAAMSAQHSDAEAVNDDSSSAVYTTSTALRNTSTLADIDDDTSTSGGVLGPYDVVNVSNESRFGIGSEPESESLLNNGYDEVSEEYIIPNDEYGGTPGNDDDTDNTEIIASSSGVCTARNSTDSMDQLSDVARHREQPTTKIFLETPMVEDALQHRVVEAANGDDLDADADVVFVQDLGSKPKRLSEEFYAETQNRETVADAKGAQPPADNHDVSRTSEKLASVRLKDSFPKLVAFNALAASSSSSRSNEHTFGSEATSVSSSFASCLDLTDKRRVVGESGESIIKPINKKNLLQLKIVKSKNINGGGGPCSSGTNATFIATRRQSPTDPTTARRTTFYIEKGPRITLRPTSAQRLSHNLAAAAAADSIVVKTTTARMPNRSGQIYIPTYRDGSSSATFSAARCSQFSQNQATSANCPVIAALTANASSSQSAATGGDIQAQEADNDHQVDAEDRPSTSSGGRCSFAQVSKSSRNASAQTNERYLSPAISRNRGRRGDMDLDNPVVFALHANRDWADENHLASVMAAGDLDMYPIHYDDENNSDVEERCTCVNRNDEAKCYYYGSSNSLNDSSDDCNEELPTFSSKLPRQALPTTTSSSSSSSLHRKRKHSEEDSRPVNDAADGNGADYHPNEGNCRKRVAYDQTSTPRSSRSGGNANLSLLNACSTVARRTPRSIVQARSNPMPELEDWLAQFDNWSQHDRQRAIDSLIEACNPSLVRHMMTVIEPQLQRDFISLLPHEVALAVLSYLEPKDLLRAAQTCRTWRYLCDDNLLWREKCRKEQILADPETGLPKRGRTGNMPFIASPWKAAYMRQHVIEMNWRSRPIRTPKILKGHDDHVITCLQFSDNRIVSGSDDNTLKVWSAVTGRCLRTLTGHTGGVWSSQMSGNIVISGSTDRSLRVWNLDTGECVHVLNGHTSTVRCMHLHDRKVVSGSRDATLRVWDIDEGSCLHVLVGHMAAVRCVQYNGKIIVSGAYDYMVKIWDPERQECLHTLQGHTNRVYSLQFDGVHVVSGSLDTSIRVWDAKTGACKHMLMGHQSLTSGMELRENILVSGNADSTVKVWDITTGQCLQTLSGTNKHQSAVTCLQFNSRFVVTSSDDGTVKLWDVKTGEFIRNLVTLDSGGSGGVVWRIRANDTKLICAVGSRNGTEETKLMVLDFDVNGACAKCS